MDRSPCEIGEDFQITSKAQASSTTEAQSVKALHSSIDLVWLQEQNQASWPWI